MLVPHTKYLVAAVALLSGCTGSPQGAQTVPAGAVVSSESSTERLIHSFGAAGDGYYPQAPLLDVNGTFYGTTENGSGSSGRWNGVQD